VAAVLSTVGQSGLTFPGDELANHSVWPRQGVVTASTRQTGDVAELEEKEAAEWAASMGELFQRVRLDLIHLV
jgi:hypothetical protein